MSLLVYALIALGALLVIGVGSHDHTLIIPLYAALVPIGGVFRIPVPLPPPFNSLSSLFGRDRLSLRRYRMSCSTDGAHPIAPCGGLVRLPLVVRGMTAFWAQQPAAAVEELSSQCRSSS